MSLEVVGSLDYLVGGNGGQSLPVAPQQSSHTTSTSVPPPAYNNNNVYNQNGNGYGGQPAYAPPAYGGEPTQPINPYGAGAYGGGHANSRPVTRDESNVAIAPIAAINPYSNK